MLSSGSFNFIPYSLSGLQNINADTINGISPFTGISSSGSYPLLFDVSTGILSQTPINQNINTTASPTFNKVYTSEIITPKISYTSDITFNTPTSSKYNFNINNINKLFIDNSGITIAGVGSMGDNGSGNLLFSTLTSGSVILFNLAGSSLNPVLQITQAGGTPYTTILGNLLVSNIEVLTITSAFGYVNFLSNDLKTYGNLKLSNTSTVYSASLAGSFSTSANYTMYMPSALPSANLPLICSTGGILSYNDQALLTSSNVTFNSVNIPYGSTYKINGTGIYIPNQGVNTTNSPTFNNVNLNSGGTYKINNVPIYIPNQSVDTTASPLFDSINISNVGTIFDNSTGNLVISTNYSTGSILFNLIGSTINPAMQISLVGTSPYINIKGVLSTPTIETDTITSQYGTVSFSSNDILTYSSLKLANTSTVYKASLAGSFITSQNYTMYMPSALPSVANLPLICGTGGGLSYNDQALQTTNDVKFANLELTGSLYNATNQFNISCTGSAGALVLNAKDYTQFYGNNLTMIMFNKFNSQYYVPYIDTMRTSRYNTNTSGQYWEINISGTTFQTINNSGVGAYITYGNNYWSNTSDIRLKKNIEPLKSSLDIINKLNPITYNWKDDTMPKKQIGFIAQEMKELIPELVEEVDENKFLGITTSGLIPFLVKSIQEQHVLFLEQKEMLLNQNKILVELTTQLNDMKKILIKNNLI